MSKRYKIILAFIILCIIASAIFLIIKFHVKDEDLKDIKKRENVCEMEVNQNEIQPLDVDEAISLRSLENEEEFKPFKIYLDLTFIRYQASLDPNLSKILKK